MSDSESSEEIEVKVQQQHSAKYKELIEKAKEILPLYSEDSLHQIYKQCFQTENVFLNKLNILAKQNLNSQGDDQEWIVEKKHLKQNNPRKFQFQQNGVQREKYNFLEDKLLIERALKYRRPSEKQREYPKKTYQQYRQKPNDNQEAHKQKTYYKSEKPNQSYQNKKVLYKEKEQAPEPTKTQNQPAPKPVVQQAPIQVPAKKPNTQSNVKQETKPAPQKKQKYMEKKQTAKVPDVKPQQKVEPVQSQPKVEQKQPVVKPKQQVKNKQVPKPKQETKQPIQPKKQVEKTAAPAKIQPVIIQQQKKQKAPEQKIVPENVASNTSITSQGQQAKTQSTKKVERVKDVPSREVDKQFENSLSQNSFILSFIKPSSKLQQISYLRYPDGKIRQVKVKQPLSKKN